MTFSLKVKNLKKLKDQLAELKAPVSEETAKEIGKTVVEEIKALIKRGISPIQSEGKFAPYKAVGKVSQAKRLKLTGKKSKKARKDLIKGAKQRGYPYTVQKQYPGKKISPVNLELSGSFLKDLTYKVSRAAKSFVSEVGYFDELSAKKEQGHREGANSQPKRPTIPTGGNEFTERISSKINKILLGRLRSILKR